MQLLDRADKDGGKCYCATYELSGHDLIKHLTALGKKKLHLVLSNAGEDTEDGSGDGDMAQSPRRTRLTCTTAGGGRFRRLSATSLPS